MQGESCARVNTAKVVWREEKLGQLQVSAEELQPLRFQGQFIDQETGLHYNRFRYFDPDLGMFTTRDPIGLMGGMNTFQYAPNPTGWIDPFGLAKTPVDCDCEDSCPPDPIRGATEKLTINQGSDAPSGSGIYSFDYKETDYQYDGSTINFKARMADHIRTGSLKPGTEVTFTHILTPGRSATGARRIRRFMEQQQMGVVGGLPSRNAATGIRAVSEAKWLAYTKNGKPDYCNDYFK